MGMTVHIKIFLPPSARNPNFFSGHATVLVRTKKHFLRGVTLTRDTAFPPRGCSQDTPEKGRRAWHGHLSRRSLPLGSAACSLYRSRADGRTPKAQNTRSASFPQHTQHTPNKQNKTLLQTNGEKSPSSGKRYRFVRSLSLVQNMYIHTSN